jgi:NAD(P)H-hydrate epimerase
MDRAGRAAARAVVALAGGRYGKRAVVLCGKGNNGGDGFVVARILAREGMAVRCYSTAGVSELRGDPAHHAAMARRAGVTLQPLPEANFAGCDVAVDALFGTGFRGEMRSPASDVVEALNASAAKVVAIDIPSGVEGGTGAARGVSVDADVTVTMAAEKIGTALPPGAVRAGEVVVADIGISVEGARVFIVERSDVAEVLPRRDPSAHKRSVGSVAVLGGSGGMSGAPILAGRGAARAGAGYVTLGVSRHVADAASAQVPELLKEVVTESDALGPEALDAFAAVIERADAVALGPGLGRGSGQRELVARVLSEVSVPVVLDADGLNVLAEDTAAANAAAAPLVLTPHPAELARLLGLDTSDVVADRLATARRAAAEMACVVVAKGYRTVVAEPSGRAVVIPTGGPALATAGSGDVLTGVIAALLAAGLDAFTAAWAGAYIHGATVDLLPEAGALAGDVAEALPQVLASIAERRV